MSSMTVPPVQATYDFEMTYDAFDGYVLLLGVVAGMTPQTGTDLWVFSHGLWSSPPVSPIPENCPGSSMAYDDHDGYVLYFAGPSTPYLPCDSANETWEYRGGSWTHLSPTLSPPGRYGAAMTNDTADGDVVLFGGMSTACAPSFECNDTWSFSSGMWSQLHPLRAPSPRQESGFTFDPAFGHAILFGGVQAGSPFGLNDTWEYLHGTWTQLFPLVSPPWPQPDAFSYDASDRQAVFTAAWNWSGPPNEVVWTFASNGTWTPVLSPGPSQRLGAATAYDYTDGYLLFFGGEYSQETWGFVRGTWTNLTDVTSALTVVTTATPAAIPLGSATVLRTTVAGGQPPFTYTYSDLPRGCLSASAPTLTCAPTETGTFPIQVVVNDSARDGGAATVWLNVTGAPLRVAQFEAIPNDNFANSSVTFVLAVTGGVPPYGFLYTGLPPGCVTFDAPSLTCLPLLPGFYVVQVQVNDSTGAVSVAQTLLSVLPPPNPVPPPYVPPILPGVVAAQILIPVSLVLGAIAIALLRLLGRPPARTTP